MNGDGTTAKVTVGKNQHLLFRETDKPQPDFDGHHIQIYVVNFSGPHRQLNERGLIFQESDQYQYRFKQLVDPDSGENIYELEHEVRSVTHPLYARPLVNGYAIIANANTAPTANAATTSSRPRTAALCPVPAIVNPPVVTPRGRCTSPP